MDRNQVITVLECLANGIDPASGARIPLEAFHSGDAVRALFTATNLLKAPAERVTKSPSAGSPWSAEEDERLTREFDSGMTLAQIALAHGRSSSAISLRLVKLGRLEPEKVKTRERGVA